MPFMTSKTDINMLSTLSLHFATRLKELNPIHFKELELTQSLEKIINDYIPPLEEDLLAAISNESNPKLRPTAHINAMELAKKEIELILTEYLKLI